MSNHSLSDVRAIAAKLHEAFGDTDPLTTEANILLAKSYGALQGVVAKYWAEFGLTSHRYTTLRLLYLADQHRLPMKDIAAGLNVGTTNVTKLINGMHRDGLVKRIVEPKDRRVIYAQLTDEGKGRYETVYPLAHKRLREAWSALDPDEKEVLIHLLAKLRTHILDKDRATLSPSVG